MAARVGGLVGSPVGRRLHVAGDAQALAARLLVEALKAFPAPRLALAGGSAVAALDCGAIAAWDHLRLTWVDERVVPFDHPDSNRGAAWRTGLLTSPGLELPLVLDGERPETALARVVEALRTRFGNGLDVLLLGLGEDGHLASLFPGLGWGGSEPVIIVPNSPKAPALRLSLSLAFLQTAPRAILLATGEHKRKALERLLDGDPALPGVHLSDLDVVTDLRFP